MKILTWDNLTTLERQTALQRPLLPNDVEQEKHVMQIIERVRTEGDKALFKFTEQFDKAKLKALRVSDKEIKQAENHLNKENRAAIEFAIKKITRYQTALKPKTVSINTAEGVQCQRLARPIESIGLYVPGGNTPLISTVMMLAIPAAIAGCKQRILCTPPQKGGAIDANLLYTAQRCGITEIYKIGGAQAIAAMAFGTETIPNVEKIFGPGNSWVTTAKKYVSRDKEGPSIDMPAGPSELMVVADDNADTELVAADILSQAEHGPDSQVIAITLSIKQAKNIAMQVKQQLTQLSRKSIAAQALKQSRIICVNSIDQAIDISNAYAPEHLILQIDNAEAVVEKITNASAVFIGPWTPETVGDYVTGANHVLPTDGYARTLSGLSVLDFMKFISVQRVTQSGLANIAKCAERLADMEGLQAHKNAVSLRLEKINEYLC